MWDASELRVKESDRIATIVRELHKMGARIEERSDGLIVEGPTRLHGARLESHGDHRLAMALAVAALVAEGESFIAGGDCAADSPPFRGDVEGSPRSEAAIQKVTKLNPRKSGSRYVGLIGWPVEHSLSPAMHNAAFAAVGLPWKYLLLPTPPATLKRAMQRLKGDRWAGANVTIPYKEAIIPHLDRLSPEAVAIGAVNTIVVRAGERIGHNTDATGFIRALGDQGFEPGDKRALVLGAGGAARAVIYALLQAGAEVVICNRTLERAEALALSLTSFLVPSSLTVRPLTDSVLEGEIGSCQLLVNATPVGMALQSQLSPWPEDVSIPAGTVVFDLVYAPLETRLLQQAKAAGAETIGGLQMLIQQGVEAFHLWTGLSPPREVIYQAALAAVSAQIDS